MQAEDAVAVLHSSSISNPFTDLTPYSDPLKISNNDKSKSKDQVRASMESDNIEITGPKVICLTSETPNADIAVVSGTSKQDDPDQIQKLTNSMR